MQAGKLNKRVTIEKPADATNAWDERVPDQWVEVGKAWASILHQSGLATIKADAQTSVVKASIRLRYRTDLAAGMRVLHGSTVYAVHAVLPEEAKREHVDLVCEISR